MLFGSVEATELIEMAQAVFVPSEENCRRAAAVRGNRPGHAKTMFLAVVVKGINGDQLPKITPGYHNTRLFTALYFLVFLFDR